MAPESRDEVRQRIDNLYDQAENATGNYNATRAMNGGSRSRGVPLFKRPRRDDPGLESIAREWFDTARSRLGPSVPAALPADRQPARPGPRRPVSPMAADLLGQVEGSGPSRPELTAGPSANSDIEVVREPAARPGRELTAGSPAALPPGSSDAPRALPAAAPRRATPGTSKTRSQLKIAKARELLSQRTGQRAVAALEPAAPAQAPQAAPVAQALWTTPEARVPARRPAPAGAPGRYGDTGASPETAVTDTGGIPIVSPTDTGTFRIITPGSAPSRLPAAPPGFRVMTPGGTGDVPAAPAMDTAPPPTATLGDTGSFRVMTPGATGTFPMPDDTGAFPAATPANTEAFPAGVPADTAAFQATASADMGPFQTMAPADMGAFQTMAPTDMGAFQTMAPTDMGAFQTMAPTDMGAFQTMAPTDMGAFQTMAPTDMGAFQVSAPLPGLMDNGAFPVMAPDAAAAHLGAPAFTAEAPYTAGGYGMAAGTMAAPAAQVPAGPAAYMAAPAMPSGAMPSAAMPSAGFGTEAFPAAPAVDLGAYAAGTQPTAAGYAAAAPMPAAVTDPPWAMLATPAAVPEPPVAMATAAAMAQAPFPTAAVPTVPPAVAAPFPTASVATAPPVAAPFPTAAVPTAPPVFTAPVPTVPLVAAAPVPAMPEAAPATAFAPGAVTDTGSLLVPGAAAEPGKAMKALEFARAQIGRPCVWGATGPESYDCSSLAQAAWRAAGVSLPRGAADQAFAGTPMTLAAIEPGDLVLFFDNDSHVGVYAGNGMMVHAPSPGASIREESIYNAGESAIHRVVRPA